MIGLPVELSQSEASMAHTQLALAGVSFLKGASEEGGGGEEWKQKQVWKAKSLQIPVKREKVCAKMQTKEFAWGVCNHWFSQYKGEF